MLHFIAQAALLLFLTGGYVSFYCITRKCTLPGTSKMISVKAAVCFLYNMLLLFILNTRNPEAFSQKPFLIFLSMLIADIDIFCKKIPTELLIGYAAICCQNLVENSISVPFFVFLLLFTVVGIRFYKKAGIGLYDLLFLAFTGSVLKNLHAFLLMIAAFLCLWGIAGLFLLRFGSKPSDEKIPLSPILILVFFFCL